MLVAAIKQHIENLPPTQFTAAWKCIEEIDNALNKAGTVALVALEYTQQVHSERLAALLAAQGARTAMQSAELQRVLSERDSDRILLEAATAREAKLQKQVAKLKKKSKK